MASTAVKAPRKAKKRSSKSSTSTKHTEHSANHRRNVSNGKAVSSSFPLDDTPLADFLAPFRLPSTQWVSRYAYLSFAVILRAAVGLGPFSGYKSKPLHGDFEAQRHWMEITNHLPISQWYYHDLEWWGLDYPPLTAYHSWILGKIGSWIDSTWFDLYTSRGHESDSLKAYMRITAILSELVIYVPALIWFVRWWGLKYKLSSSAVSVSTAAILFQPALILIDHGHFQYNSVMLGFTLVAIVNLVYDNHYLASFFFVLSLSFKQMALYYAPVIFSYLLGICVLPTLNVFRLAAIGLVVISSFSAMVGPFIAFGGTEQLQQVLHRVFPFARGLWEDKVANLWCTLNTFIKLKHLFTSSQLQLVSLLATTAGMLPVMIITTLKPKKQILPWAFSACAWAFFLFSFQVHEKSVLIPLMPATLLLASTDYDEVALTIWINNMAMFSMYPLLSRENLRLQFFVMTFVWNWLLGFKLPRKTIFRLTVVLYYLAIAILCVLQMNPPAAVQSLIETRYTDLWVVLNVTLSFSSFILYWFWNLYKLYKYAAS